MSNSTSCALIISGVTKISGPPYRVQHLTGFQSFSTDILELRNISSALTVSLQDANGRHRLARITSKRILIVKLKFRYQKRSSACDSGMRLMTLISFLSLSTHPQPLPFFFSFPLQAQRAWIERNFHKRECIHIFPTKDPTR